MLTYLQLDPAFVEANPELVDVWRMTRPSIKTILEKYPEAGKIIHMTPLEASLRIKYE